MQSNNTMVSGNANLCEQVNFRGLVQLGCGGEFDYEVVEVTALRFPMVVGSTSLSGGSGR